MRAFLDDKPIGDAQVVGIDDILSIDSPQEFERVAMEIFAFQSAMCAPYREYLELIGVDSAAVKSSDRIPFLPIEVFKYRTVYCGAADPEIIFTSSNTGGTKPSEHHMAHVLHYEQTFRRCFELFYGAPEQWSIYALLPSYLEREGSSLIYMADKLIERGRGGGFYLDDYPKLIADMAADKGEKILLGVSYALLDLAENFAPDLSGIVVMETGGMKGRREELSKEALHKVLCEALNVETIDSEYGMAELSSQAYSRGGGIFRCAPWMKVSTRDLNDPFVRHKANARGGINIIDLANIYSCAFIQTQDVGVVDSDGSFRIDGRAERSEIRGCNLLLS